MFLQSLLENIRSQFIPFVGESRGVIREVEFFEFGDDEVSNVLRKSNGDGDEAFSFSGEDLQPLWSTKEFGDGFLF